jgi:hypothetical protein
VRVVSARAVTTRPTAILSLFTVIVLSTPWVRAETLAETTPDVCPAASKLAALHVDVTNANGADADADPADSIVAAEPVSTTPRCLSRFASMALALASRLATLPSGMPSCRAASFRVMPSRSHKTTTPR